MKKKLWVLATLVLFAASGLIALVASQVKAAEQGDVITRVYITDQAGNELTGDIEQWQTFRLNSDFTLPDNEVKEGDTTTVKIPDIITFTDTAAFDVKDADGNVVAKAVVDEATKEIKLTYTKFVETHSGIKGSFYFYVRVDHNVIQDAQTMPLGVTVNGKFISGGNYEFAGVGEATPYDIGKSAWKQNDADPSLIRYHLSLNTSGKDMTNVKVVDVLQNTSLSYVEGSFEIHIGDWVSRNGEWFLENGVDRTSDFPVTISGNTFSVDLGNLDSSQGVSIYYSAKIPYTPVDGEIFYNDATLTTDNSINSTASRSYTFYEGGGQAEGYVYSIKINKVNESNQPLENAVFDVIRVRSGQTVGQITTDSSGEGTLGQLLNDEYILKEVSAPSGYSLAEDVTVNPADFDSTSKVAEKTIVNKQVATTTTTTTTTSTTTTTTATTTPTTTESTSTTTASTSPTTTETTTASTAASTTTTTTEITASSTATTESTTSTTATTTTEATTTASTTSTTAAPTTSASTTEAGTTHSVTTRPSDPKTSGTTTSSKPKKSGLPSTGDETGVWLAVLGGFTLLTAAYYYRKAQV